MGPRLEVANLVPLSHGSLWSGGANDAAQEVSIGLARQVLQVNPSGTEPEWTSNLRIDSLSVADLHVRDNGIIDGDLSVNGTDVNLPDGSIQNDELENSSVDISYGVGLSGDPTLSLGGTLTLQNDGVTELIAGDGVGLDQSTGEVTVTNTGLLDAASGDGIDVAVANGTATITNVGVLSLSGTANQVIADHRLVL